MFMSLSIEIKRLTESNNFNDVQESICAKNLIYNDCLPLVFTRLIVINNIWTEQMGRVGNKLYLSYGPGSNRNRIHYIEY
jgi:hypothetical protein